MNNRQVIGVIVGAVIIFYVLQKRAIAQTRTRIPGSSGAIRPGSATNRPGILGVNGADSSLINTFANALKSILGVSTDKKTSSGGTGAGGGMSSPSPNSGTAANQGQITNAQINPSLNFGSYVGLNGQLYNIDGQALDDNGRPIPGEFDNSGTGPAGAGINFDNTIATNPLEFGNPNDPGSAMYGVVIPINTPGLVTIPNQSGSGDYIAQLQEAADASSGYPPADASLTALPSTPIGQWVDPNTDYSLSIVPDPSQNPSDGSGTANRTDPGVPPDSMVSDPNSDLGSVGNTFDPTGPTSVDPSLNDYSTGGDVFESTVSDYNTTYGY